MSEANLIIVTQTFFQTYFCCDKKANWVQQFATKVFCWLISPPTGLVRACLSWVTTIHHNFTDVIDTNPDRLWSAHSGVDSSSALRLVHHCPGLYRWPPGAGAGHGSDCLHSAVNTWGAHQIAGSVTPITGGNLHWYNDWITASRGHSTISRHNLGLQLFIRKEMQWEVQCQHQL